MKNVPYVFLKTKEDSDEVYNWHDGNKNNFKNNWGSNCAKT